MTRGHPDWPPSSFLPASISCLLQPFSVSTFERAVACEFGTSRLPRSIRSVGNVVLLPSSTREHFGDRVVYLHSFALPEICDEYYGQRSDTVECDTCRRRQTTTNGKEA